MMGLEPTTFCMASRRSSQLSYIRRGPEYSPRSGSAEDAPLTLPSRRHGGVAYAGACKALYTGSIPVVASSGMSSSGHADQALPQSRMRLKVNG